MRAIFLDRDGVLIDNVVRSDQTVGSPRSRADVIINPLSVQFVESLRQLSYSVVVVTNQPDIARHLLSLNELLGINSLIANRIPGIESIATCIHDKDDGCTCRKPLPGMLTKAAERLGIDLNQSWMIGDRSSDIEAGAACGVRSICVPSLLSHSRPRRTCESHYPHFQADDLIDALRIITANSI